MIMQCSWCGRRYSDYPFSYGYCSEACRHAAAHKDDIPESSVTYVNNGPQSYIGMPETGFTWSYPNSKTIKVGYGRIVNSGSANSGLLRIGVYSSYNGEMEARKNIIGSYSFNRGLAPNESISPGSVTISITAIPLENDYLLVCVEKYESGSWIPCASAHSKEQFTADNIDWFRSAPKTSTTSTSSSSSSSSSRTTTSSSSTKTTSGTSSSSTVTNTANKGKTKLSLDIGTFKVTGRVCEISYNKIKNNSPWESGTLRFALYYSNTNVIKDSVTVGRTYLGCSPEKDGLRVGNFYDKYSYKIDMSTDIPKGNYLLILLEEKDNSGKWNWRNGWASSTMSPF